MIRSLSSILFAILLTQSSVGAATTASDEMPPGGDYVGADICAECHEEQFEQILPSKHAQMNDLRTPFAIQGCESCHGRGETHAMSDGEDFTGLVVFGKDSPVPAHDQNGQCLGCHQNTGRMHWQGSAHESADLACSHCHLIHQPDGVLREEKEFDLCTSCHRKVRGDLYKASVHPVRQGLLACTDCHSPHGSAGPKALQRLTLNQQCFTCHAEKRGPFLWEHEPVTEDCAACHVPHGSNNAALLRHRGPFLCQQCHQNVGRLAGHINQKRELGGAGNARFLFGANCMNCHSQVHGSNHPSGFALQR